MKLCMMSYTMARQPEHFSLRGMLDLTVELGLTGIDFVTLHDTPPEELRKMTEDRGITIACYTFMADLNFMDAKGRQAGVDACKQSIHDAVILGTDKTMLPTPGKQGISSQEARHNYIEGLKAVSDFAKQAGITMTVENFPGASGPFLLAEEVLEGIREVPGLALTFDNGNVLTGGEDPAESFSRCAQHVLHAHFKDWHYVDPETGMQGRDGKWYRGGLIGEGLVDHRSCLKAMAQAGYQGFINIEYEGNIYTPEQATRKAAAYLQGLIDEIKEEERR